MREGVHYVPVCPSAAARFHTHAAENSPNSISCGISMDQWALRVRFHLEDALLWQMVSSLSLQLAFAHRSIRSSRVWFSLSPAPPQGPLNCFSPTYVTETHLESHFHHLPAELKHKAFTTASNQEIKNGQKFEKSPTGWTLMVLDDGLVPLAAEGSPFRINRLFN